MEKFAIPELDELIDEKLLQQINGQIDSPLNLPPEERADQPLVADQLEALNNDEVGNHSNQEQAVIAHQPEAQGLSITEPQELILEPDIFSSDDITLDPVAMEYGEITSPGESGKGDGLAQENSPPPKDFTLGRPSYDRVSKYMVGGLVIAGMVGTLAYGGYQWWKQQWVTQNYENQALALEQGGDLEGALSLYDQSLQNHPTGKIYLKRGLLRKELGQFKEAIDDFPLPSNKIMS
ncbi:MAG: tetratricopeptide repeat protein [Synechococcaceae cyanobacterium RL_1_2]|nr:tetratricopeptide repeat protein [Synechococcaceae cyanobacterium RL_1_2]